MDAISRVKEYLRQKHKAIEGGSDPDVVEIVWTDVNADSAPLLIMDIETLLHYVEVHHGNA